MNYPTIIIELFLAHRKLIKTLPPPQRDARVKDTLEYVKFLFISRVRCPVRFMLDRDEDMISTGTRHPFLGRYKVGCTKEGKLVGVDIKLFSNGGFSYDVSTNVSSFHWHPYSNYQHIARKLITHNGSHILKFSNSGTNWS